MANLSTTATPIQSSSISKVRVVVRLRPFLALEVESRNGDANPTPCVSILDRDPGDEEVPVFLKDPHSSRSECYKLDSFFGQDDNSVGRIFYSEVCRLIPGIFRGHNATVFAYGATGSGKTYTMEGTEDLPGLMPLAMSTILSMCQCSRSTAEISYYEVYMDRCFDLLEPKENEIAVMDDKGGQIHLRGLSRVPISSMSEFHGALSCATQRRKVGHTSMNDASSRSHGVLVISVSTPAGDGLEASFAGKLNLIDLAGNEDNRRTCNEGMRLQESAKINQSLFALSNVIYALNNNKPRVPYRESKLTRILQDSLGGTSHALMVACLNPGEYHESVHTVRLAARSRHISNFVHSAQKGTPKVKVDMEAKLRAWLESKGKAKSAQGMGSFGGSPSLNGTPVSVSSVNRKGIFHSNVKTKVNAHRAASSVKNRGISGLPKNLFSSGVSVDSRVEEVADHENVGDSMACGIATNGNNCSTVAKDGIFTRRPIVPEESFDVPTASSCQDHKIKPAADAILLQSETPLPDETPKHVHSVSSPDSESVKASQSSLRRVLSPVSANLSVRPDGNDLSFMNQKCFASFEPKTPQTPCLFGTPLEKFNATSSNLKGSLAQEYIDFLNAASQEELVEIKGIGLRTAEYIIELRETSPLKSLNDLEKMGLSSKQVRNMFNSAARGVFVSLN